MEMIEDLGRRKSQKGQDRSWGLFLCSYCGSLKEYNKYRGKQNKSCGCVSRVLAWETIRGKETLNEYEKHGNSYTMKLYNRTGIYMGVAIIDSDDYHKVNKYIWRMTTRGYVYNSRIKKLLHTYLTGFTRSDHIDGNPLNNRKENLRESTNTQNCRNCKISKNNTSGYKGVIFLRDVEKWGAQIMVNRKNKNLGRYKDKKDAARAYNKAAVKYFGEFAKLNDI